MARESENALPEETEQSAKEEPHTIDSSSQPVVTQDIAVDRAALIASYLAAGLTLIDIPAGQKGPNSGGWNERDNVITTPEQAAQRLNGNCNLGLAHAYCTPYPTCAIDIDDMGKARVWLAERCIDLDALLADPAAVRIHSHRPGKGKLLYRVPRVMASRVMKDGKVTILEFRCASEEGRTVQDVLPPSIHPDTGRPYTLTGDITAIPTIPDALLHVWEQANAAKASASKASAAGSTETSGVTRFDELLHSDEKLRKRWEGSMEGLGDGASRSELDMSLVALMTIDGFNDAEITTVLHAFKHGKVAQDGRNDDYIKPMIAKTRQKRVLGRATPLRTARRLLAERYTNADGVPLLRHWQDEFYRWQGSVWQPVAIADIDAVIQSYLEGGCCYKPKGRDKEEPFNPTPTSVEAVRKSLARATHIGSDHSMPCWMDQRKGDPDPDELLAMANGLLHLPSRTLLAHTPRYFTTLTLPYAYDPHAELPMAWLKFLHQLWPDDPESVRALQDWAGYLLTSDTSQQKIMMLIGPPRGGKGVIARVLQGMLGATNCIGPTLNSLATNFGLAPLVGKSLAIISDARLGHGVDLKVVTERLLTISGGDRQTFDRKNREAWTGLLHVRFMLCSNELPALEDASGALASRFIVLRLTESWLGREDTGLADRLLGELPGIFNWALEGLARLHKRGHFQQPASADELIQELKDSSSPIKAFLRECCVVEPDARVETKLLYLQWKSWCLDNGLYPGSNKDFGQDLHAAVSGIRKTRPREDGSRTHYYVGVGHSGGHSDGRNLMPDAAFQQVFDRMKKV